MSTESLIRGRFNSEVDWTTSGATSNTTFSTPHPQFIVRSVYSHWWWSASYSNLVYKVRDWLMEPPGLGVIKRILISINLRLQFISCQNNNSGNLLLISGTYKSVIYNNKQKLQVLIKVNLTLWRYLIELSASLYWLVHVCIRAYNEYAN